MSKMISVQHVKEKGQQKTIVETEVDFLLKNSVELLEELKKAEASTKHLVLGSKQAITVDVAGFQVLLAIARLAQQHNKPFEHTLQFTDDCQTWLERAGALAILNQLKNS